MLTPRLRQQRNTIFNQSSSCLRVQFMLLTFLRTSYFCTRILASLLSTILLSILSYARISFQITKINEAACDLAKEVAKEGGVYFAGCINQTAFLYSQGAGKDVLMKKFREQIDSCPAGRTFLCKF